MTKYKIKLYSKNKQSLEHFSKLLKKTDNKLQNQHLILNISKIKKKRKRITILKSPHVNKKAQEQFQSIIYSSIIECSSWEIKKKTIMLKKIKNHLFPDIKLKIEKTFSSNGMNLLKQNHFNPKRTHYTGHKKIMPFKNIQKIKILASNKQFKNQKWLKKTVLYLKLLDNYGQLNEKP